MFPQFEVERRRAPLAPVFYPPGKVSWPAGRCRGATLIEVAVWCLLVALMGSPVLSAFLTSTRLMVETDAAARIQERARAVLHRIERDVRLAMADSLAIENEGKSLVLVQALGFTDLGPRPGGIIRYDIETASGEAANSKDDDGNGLVDEAQIARSYLGRKTIVAAPFDPHLTRFTGGGGTVTATVASLGRLASSGVVVSLTRARNMSPRN